MQSSYPPGLYIVATPIGNLGDISSRARDILAAADIVAVEDSRVTGKLLHHLGLKKRMRPYHDHSGEADRDALLHAARDGIVALVSDAGTPLISDPGYKLVRAAQEAGVFVTTAPGPSAAIAALTLSGLPTDRFLFAGFLHSKAVARDRAIAELAGVDATLLLYENGQRLAATIASLHATLGEREAAVVREITKLHEQIVRGTLAQLARDYADADAPRGEIVIVVGPPAAAGPADETEIEAALDEALTRLSPGRAASEVATRFDTDRRALYARALARKGG